MSKVKVINALPVTQSVPGYGEAAPGKALEVPERVAAHLLRSEAWQEPKPREKKPGRGGGKTGQAQAPPVQAGGESKEVSDGS